MSVPVPSTPTNPEVRVSPEGLVAVRRPGSLDEWAVVAGPGNSWLADVRPGADEVYGWTPLVPAPVLEGLRAELAEAADALDKVAEERDAYRAELAKVREALQTPGGWATRMHALRVRQERDKASDAAARLQQVAERATHLAGRVLSEFIQKGYPGGPSVRTGWVGADTVTAWHRELAELSRPSVSDQTPATPDPAGFSVLVCDEPELHKQSGQHDDECWIDAGLHDPAPSSVQGDTTPKEA